MGRSRSPTRAPARRYALSHSVTQRDKEELVHVRLEPNFVNDSYRVWIYERSPTRVMQRAAGGGWRFDPFDESELPPPTLELPEDALRALLEEAGKVLPATHATERHLQDAIAVRDRLLNLVESGWET
jgi:hypothetical protein